MVIDRSSDQILYVFNGLISPNALHLSQCTQSCKTVLRSPRLIAQYTCHHLQGTNLIYLSPTGYVAIAARCTCHQLNTPTILLYRPPTKYVAIAARCTCHQLNTPTVWLYQPPTGYVDITTPCTCHQLPYGYTGHQLGM